MNRTVPFLLLGILVLGCGGQDLIGQRFQAERSLWKADHELKRLSIRPDLVTEEEWYAIADRFEGIAERYGSLPVLPDSTAEGTASRDIHIVVARALLDAAQVHGAVRDSSGMLELFTRIAQDYSDVPQIAGEVALAQAGIAQGKGDWNGAIQAYQRVLDSTAPTPGEPGAGGVVMEIPLRIARIQAGQAGGTVDERAPYYAEAILYYEDMIANHPGTRVEVTARQQLARIASDLQQWDRAIEELTLLEKELLDLHPRPRDPGEVRFAIAMVQKQAPGQEDASEATLQSLVEDYPESPYAPRALLALAGDAADAGNVEAALGYLDRVGDEYSKNEAEAAQAMLNKGRVLETNDRWPEALEIFRALPVQHPTSEASLLAPLEIVKHFERVGDDPARKDALARAEREYREFIARYPQGVAYFSAREKLAQTLAMEQQYNDAVNEMVSLGEALVNTRRGASLMINAAKMAYVELGDTTRAAEILDRVGTLYANADLGRWANGEAARIRGEAAN